MRKGQPRAIPLLLSGSLVKVQFAETEIETAATFPCSNPYECACKKLSLSAGSASMEAFGEALVFLEDRC